MNVEPPDFGDEYYETAVNYKTCNRCGAGKLHWDDASGLLGIFEGKPVWRLFEENNEMHQCRK